MKFIQLAAVVTCAFIYAPQATFAQKPKNEKRIKARPMHPPVVPHHIEVDGISYRIKIRPGVTTAGQTVNIDIEVSEILDNPHPTYGQRKPLDEARLVAVLVGPKVKKKKKGSFVDARTGFKQRDAGTYGVSFTAPTDGIYGLHIKGSSSAGPLSASVPLSYGIWPIPDDAKVPALPKTIPEATDGNMAEGKRMCAERCKKDHPSALPKGKTPTFLASHYAEGRSDVQLLQDFLGEAVRSMSVTQARDLLYYLRSLHFRVTDFFPEAAHFMAHDFSINEFGLERLKDTAGLTLTEKQKTATVFVIYKGKKAGAAEFVDYDDTVARDELDKNNKIGYLMFLDLPKEKKAAELAIALEKEPSYAVRGVKGRDNKGRRDSAFNRQLAGFKGQGGFNDPKSIKKGSASLRKTFTPVYLRAAELATAYFAAEREFTAFDDEFN